MCICVCVSMCGNWWKKKSCRCGSWELSSGHLEEQGVLASPAARTSNTVEEYFAMEDLSIKVSQITG